MDFSPLLDILCCPETHQSFTLADASLIRRLNADIAAGRIKNRSGQIVKTSLDAGLLREDGKWLYPIRDDIPILLIEEALAPSPLQ